MNLGSVVVLAVLSASIMVRCIISYRWLGATVDLGDVLLVAIIAFEAVLHGDPVHALGITGEFSGIAVRRSVAVFGAGAIGGQVFRRYLWNKWRPWMEKAGVNPGGAYLALIASPPEGRVGRGALFTASGALLEEVVFRGLLLRSIARVMGLPWAVVLQAQAFGLLHCIPLWVSGAPAPVVAYAMLMPTALGTMLGLLASSGLAYPWLVHWGLNFAAVYDELVYERETS